MLFALAAAVLSPSFATAQPPDGGLPGAGLACEPTPNPPPASVCRGATLEKGDAAIEATRYEEAVDVFSCVLAAEPFKVDAYRGRMEAELLLGRYSDAFHEYALLTANVLPIHPGAPDDILASYAVRLAARPNDVPALMGASFARWCFFDYPGALPLLDDLLELRADSVYGHLFRGSTRLFIGEDVHGGAADLARAVQLAPLSADVRYVIADAYTYAQHDPVWAFTDAELAFEWGLRTPRIHAILASSLLTWGDTSGAAAHIERHIGLVTTDLVLGAPLALGDVVTLDLVPGRTYELSVEAEAGEKIQVETDNPSGEVNDSILVVFAPDGSPVHSGDDELGSLAALEWVAPQTGTYQMWVTSFEAVGLGRLVVSRK